VDGRAAGDHARHGRRAALEPQLVGRQAGRRDRRRAAGAVLGDLEQVDLVGGQQLGQRADQLAAELGRRAGLGRGASDALQRGLGGLTART
jgi:hypothetical protein